MNRTTASILESRTNPKPKVEDSDWLHLGQAAVAEHNRCEPTFIIGGANIRRNRFFCPIAVVMSKRTPGGAPICPLDPFVVLLKR